MRHPEIETSTYNEPRRGSVCENITKHKASTTDRTSPMCERRWRYSFTAWRTYVLIRCYLQPSLAEALCIFNFFSIRYRPHDLRRANWKRIRLSPHGALTCLYGVTYSRASPRLFPWYYLRLLHTDRASPRCECVWEGFVCHRMAHLRAYTVLLTAEPRRGSLHI